MVDRTQVDRGSLVVPMRGYSLLSISNSQALGKKIRILLRSMHPLTNMEVLHPTSHLCTLPIRHVSLRKLIRLIHRHRQVRMDRIGLSLPTIIVTTPGLIERSNLFKVPAAESFCTLHRYQSEHNLTFLTAWLRRTRRGKVLGTCKDVLSWPVS
jgi:hypothetical protein